MSPKPSVPKKSSKKAKEDATVSEEVPETEAPKAKDTEKVSAKEKDERLIEERAKRIISENVAKVAKSKSVPISNHKKISDSLERIGIKRDPNYKTHAGKDQVRNAELFKILARDPAYPSEALAGLAQSYVKTQQEVSPRQLSKQIMQHLYDNKVIDKATFLEEIA